MRFKNIDNVCDFNSSKSQTMSKNSSEILNCISIQIEKRQIEKNCQQIARGVLIRLNINEATKELTSLIGDLNSSNNLDATTKWIIALSPKIESITKNDIDHFTSQLRDHIEEQLNW